MTYAERSVLLIILVILTGSMNLLFAQQITVTSSITVTFTSPDGMGDLGLSEVPVDLSIQEVYQVVIPGEPYTPAILADSEIGSRLQYSVFKDLQEKRIVVYTSDDIPSGLLYVEVVNGGEPFGTGDAGTAVGGKVNIGSTPQTLISGIGNCFTGITAADGPLLEYTLSDRPVSDFITVQYALVDDE